MWEPRPLTPLWAFTACYRDSFTLLNSVVFTYFVYNPQNEITHSVLSKNKNFFSSFLIGKIEVSFICGLVRYFEVLALGKRNLIAQSV
jgi:hypothetical protein